MKINLPIFLFMAGSFFVAFSHAKFEDSPLIIDCENEKTYSLTQLKSKLKSHTITIKNPFYKDTPEIAYRAFKFDDVLKLAQCDLSHPLLSEALDGYRQSVASPNAAKAVGYIAYEQTKGWSPIGNKESSPAPFFLVWDKPLKKLGWPYQLRKILYKLDSHHTELPSPLQANEGIKEGHSLFNSKCVACHQVGSVGGDLGPNLSTPVAVTTYMQRPFLKQYILDRTQVRKYDKSMMPQFKDQLSEKEVENIINYIEWFAKSKPL